jgi:hypothetical protein
MRANLGQIHDELLVVGDVLDRAAATRAPLERLEAFFVDVVGGLVRANISCLATRLATASPESFVRTGRLPLRGTQGLRQLSQELLDLLL